LIVSNFSEELIMRTFTLAFATVAAICAGAPAFAAQLPTDAQCHAIARQRGGSEIAGRRAHESFIRDCVAGRVPMTEVPRLPDSVRELRAVSSDVCHEIAQRRGSGETAGRRAHDKFIRDCMAGKVPLSAAARVRTETRDLRKRSEEECHVIALQRGSSETAGRRTHDKFIRDCMAGKVS
jgi:hypothetical protein